MCYPRPFVHAPIIICAHFTRELDLLISELQAQLSKETSEKSAAQQGLAAAQAKNAELKAELQSKEKALVEHQTAVAALRKELEAVKSALADANSKHVSETVCL